MKPSIYSKEIISFNVAVNMGLLEFILYVY